MADDKPIREPLEPPKRMTEAELQRFVIDYLAGSIYTNWDVPENLWQQVFMPLLFIDIPPAVAKVTGCFYASAREERSVRYVNGFPMFLGVRFMHADDWKIAKATILAEQAKGLGRVVLVKP
jgi:hypothetical protein